MPDEADGLAGDMTALGISAPGHGLLGADRWEDIRLNTELLGADRREDVNLIRN
jgi:hypothetical protein